MHNTSHEFGFAVVTNQRSLKVIVRLFRAEPLCHQPEAGYRRIILRWLANFVVLCQNEVILAFCAPKTMELILVVFISGGMVENSQNGRQNQL